MSNKIFLKSLLLATLIGGCAFVSTPNKNIQSFCANEQVTQRALEAGEQAETPDFENSDELTQRDLMINITNSTITPISQAYDVTFASQVVAYTDNDRNVFIRVNDPTFDAAKKPDKDSGKVFTGEIHKIQGLLEPNSRIVLPHKMSYGSRFDIVVDKISYAVVDDPAQAALITEIVIPKEITTITKDAFELFEGRTDVTFKLEASQDEVKTITNDDFPTGPKVLWDQPFASAAAKKKLCEVKVSGSAGKFGNGKDFLLGYHGTGIYDVPLQIGYYLQEEGKEDIFVRQDIDLNIDNISKKFELIGETGRYDINKTINIKLEPGQSVDDSRLYFFNIFEPTKDENGKYIPQYVVPPNEAAGETEPHNGRHYGQGKIAYILKDTISNYFNLKFDKIHTFSDYTQFGAELDVKKGIYEKLKNDSYVDNISKIESGDFIIRTRFTNLNLAKLKITYVNLAGEEKQVIYKVNSRYDFYNLPSDGLNHLNFLVKNEDIADDFNPSGVKGIQVIDLYVTLDLFQPLEQRVVTKSKLTRRFGVLDFLDLQEEPLDVVDLSRTTGIVIGIYCGAFLLIAVVYFLIVREVFKNDEFRRVKPKVFLKKALIAFVACLIILLAILSIIFRFFVLVNSAVVFNPIDPMVVVFVIAAALAIGYYIRNLVVYTRVNIEKKKAEKLKLEEDVDDDGTN